MNKRLAAAILAVWMAFSLAGCGEKEEIPPVTDPVEDEIVTPDPVPEIDPNLPKGINPLTGMPMEPEYENDRPVAVMLNNLKAAQPQLGVSKADIIYEIPAEGAVTRMIGIFQSLEGVGNLGSIRSTRSYYLEAALGHDAVLVHAGASPQAYQEIPAWGVDNIDGIKGGNMGNAFWRDADRKKTAGYEHSLLTSGEKISAFLASGTYSTEHAEDYRYEQAFVEDGTPAGGAAAETVTLKFSSYKTGVFEYDDNTKQYLVSQYNGPYVDGNTGERVGVTNVLVLETDISLIPGDTAGRLNVRMTGTGSGTYFCGGKSVPITWNKTDRNSPFTYQLQDGTALSLGKGTSYVCIMDPNSSTLSIG
ncbi:MAG: DUF3048 domain-containing protein [Ruminococcaceae bacterium]|nr:DUF3048 domain-containing protein [Oscillospiraceae bacterium]